MSIIVVKKEDQARGSFNNGEILENKPIGFPQDNGVQKAYSNLFYWAHAHASKGSTIGLHPHKGFEIVSYVLKGAIKHYDTKTDKWWDLEEGDFQVIKSGNGISHSEELEKDSEIFQIWFDPNLNESLYKEPAYADYKSELLPIEINENRSIKTIVGENSPVKLDTEGIRIQEITLKKNFLLALNSNYSHSIYVIHGKVILNDKQIEKDDFAILNKENEIQIDGEIDSKLFIISSPTTPTYTTYINS